MSGLTLSKMSLRRGPISFFSPWGHADFVSSFSPHTPPFFKAMVVSCLPVHAGGARKTKTRLYCFFPNLFFLFSGPPGECESPTLSPPPAAPHVFFFLQRRKLWGKGEGLLIFLQILILGGGGRGGGLGTGGPGRSTPRGPTLLFFFSREGGQPTFCFMGCLNLFVLGGGARPKIFFPLFCFYVSWFVFLKGPLIGGGTESFFRATGPLYFFFP